MLLNLWPVEDDPLVRLADETPAAARHLDLAVQARAAALDGRPEAARDHLLALRAAAGDATEAARGARLAVELELARLPIPGGLKQSAGRLRQFLDRLPAAAACPRLKAILRAVAASEWDL